MTEPEVNRSSHFAKVPEKLLSDPSLPDSAVRVFAALHRFGTEPESCFPSIARIAEMGGTNPTTVKKALNALENAGWIRRFKRATAHGLKTSNGYKLYQAPTGRNRPIGEPETPGHQMGQNRPVEPPGDPSRNPRSPDGSESAQGWAGSDPSDGPESVPTDGPNSAHEREPVQPEPSNQSSTSGTQTTHARRPERPPRTTSFTDLATDDAGFREFCAVYPKPVKLKAARSAYRSALGRASAEEINRGAQRYAEWCEREGEKLRFADDPADWLTGDRWADPYQANRPKDSWWEWVEDNGAQTARTSEELAAIGLTVVDGALVSLNELGTVGVEAST